MTKNAENTVTVGINRDKYTSTRTANGTKSLSNGDSVALALAGLTIEQCHTVAQRLLKMDTAEKYGHLNEGMQRMNVGNRVRAAVNNEKEGTPSLADLVKITGPMQTKNINDREKAAATKAKEKAAADKAKADAKVKAKPAAK